MGALNLIHFCWLLNGSCVFVFTYPMECLSMSVLPLIHPTRLQPSNHLTFQVNGFSEGPALFPEWAFAKLSLSPYPYLTLIRHLVRTETRGFDLNSPVKEKEELKNE